MAKATARRADDIPAGRRSLSIALATIRAEFEEMPCLQLTLRQAMRLWTLDEAVCRAHLETLCAQGFLRLSPEGRYTRRDA